MSNDWMPNVKRRKASYGSSNAYQGGTPKVVWHSTESDPGTIEGNLNYAEGVGYGPHIWWDPSTGEIVQVLPVSTPATALADPHGRGINRMGGPVIQIEVIGRAAKAPLAGDRLKGRDRIMAFLRSHGIKDKFPAGVPTGLSGNRSVYANGSPSGHYTHSQIPENSHVDPGRINAELLFGHVKTREEKEIEMLDEFIDGQQRARERHRNGRDVGDPPEGKGPYFRAGWNDVRFTLNNSADPKHTHSKPKPEADA